MRRVTLCVLVSLAFLGGLTTARANGYAERVDRAWYTSSCCYAKVARDDVTVRYVQVERSYRPTPVQYVQYDWRYRANNPWAYYGPSHSTYYPYRAGSPYANYVPPPDCRLVRLTDGAGGWIWARRAGCF